MTMRALEAVEALRGDRIDAGVLHVPTIKPLDEATVLKAARKGRMVVVAENHTVMGGLGEAIAGLLLRSDVRPPAFRQIALPDEFLDAGALPTLHERYGISLPRCRGGSRPGSDRAAHQAHPHFRGGSHVARAGLRRPTRRTSRSGACKDKHDRRHERRGNTMVTHTNRRTFLKGVGVLVAAPPSSAPPAKPGPR